MEPSDPTAATLTVEDVWRDVAGPLRAFVRRRIPDLHAVDDVVAEVMLRIHTHLDGLDDHEKVNAWVFRMTRNVIADHYRRSARLPEMPADLAETQLAGGDDVDGWVDDRDEVGRELAGLLPSLVQRLPDDYRRALELTDLGGLTQTEAAHIEHVSVSGMKSRVQRGRRRLAALLHERCAITLDATGRPADCTPRGGGTDCGCGSASRR